MRTVILHSPRSLLPSNDGPVQVSGDSSCKSRGENQRGVLRTTTVNNADLLGPSKYLQADHQTLGSKRILGQ